MSLYGKKLLIQGAGRGHLGLMETCKKLGVSTVVTGMKGNYPCIPLADKFMECDIRDKEGILKIARQEKVDGIIICCSDTGLESVGYVNDQLCLKGISENAAQLCSDKLKMKTKLVEAEVRTAKFFPILTKQDIKEAVQKLEFPLILKATDLQGSRGIYIVQNEKEAYEAYEKVCKQTRNPYSVLEEFIEGREFGAQAFISDGEVLFVLPHGDNTIRCGTNVPIGHYMPYELTQDLCKDTELQVKNAIKALGIDNSAVNVDLIEKDGKVYIIELTGRVGANCLPELTGNYFGIDYYEMIVSQALGINPTSIFRLGSVQKSTKAQMLKSSVSGTVSSISLPFYDTSGLIMMFIHAGDEVRAFKNSNDAIGQIIVTGISLEECEEKIDNIISNIKIDVK